MKSIKRKRMRTLKLIRFTVLIVTLFFTSISCTNDNKEEPITPPESFIEDFNQTNMSFSEEAGEQTFSFTANGDWTVDVASTSGGNVWCKASPTEGKAGSQTVKITTTENDTYDDRSVTVTLKSGDESKTFVVTQKQKDAILINSNKIEVEQKGGTITIEVKANVNYTATIGETCKDWITESSNTRALSSTEETYSIALNEHGEKREGTITFTNGTLSETVHIYQAGGDIILLSKNEYYVDAAGEDITVELRSNCEYEVEMPAVDWIHTTSSRSMSSHTLHYTIDTNETYDSREAKIIYRNKKKNIADTLTIIQAQKDAIVLTQKEYIVGALGETIEVKVASNTKFSISCNQNWITPIENEQTRALTENLYYFKIDKTLGNKRQGTISFISDNGIRENIAIVQEGVMLELISENQIFVNAKSQTIKIKVNSNIPFEVDIKPVASIGEENLSSEVEWIKQTTEPGDTISFAIEENKESKKRCAKIVFVNEDFNVYKEAVSIEQRGGIKEVSLKAAGTLERLIEGNETDLKINGPINGIDISKLRNMMTKTLTYLDLSGASIVSGGAYRYDDDWRHEIETTDDIIGKYMFYNLSIIETIILPKSATAISDFAFSSSRKISSIVIPDNIVSIGAKSFSNCTNLSNVIIGKNVTSIGIGAFAKTNISNIVIPDGVTTIPESLFGSCRNLHSVTLSKNTSTIESDAFSGCSNLQEITFPEKVSTIESYAFNGCESLLSINIPGSVTSYRNAFEGCINLKSVTISNGVTIIDSDAFKELTNLEEVYMPTTVKKIEGNAFMGCQKLENINIPNSVIEIGSHAFANTGLINITIPNSVKAIGIFTFIGCDKLSSISIGSGIVKISDRAFEGPIKECRIYATIPPEVDSPFLNSAYSESVLYVPKGCVKAYEDAGWLRYFYNIYEMDN